MFPTVPYPPIPEWLPIDSVDRPVALRTFGADMRDLAVEFADVDRPRLVTSLLARCAQTRSGGSPSEQAIWALPLGSRIEAIVALAGGHSSHPLEWRVRCGYAGCGAESELELYPAEISTVASKAYREELAPVKIGSQTAWLRRPTGADQLKWLSEESAPTAPDLFVEPRFEDLGVTPEEAGDSIDQAMDEYDPLVGFHLEVNCAECGQPTTQAPDLLAAALERLWTVQFDLVKQVHRLAAYYHWTEEEIAKLPAWRRQAYLAYIDGGDL